MSDTGWKQPRSGSMYSSKKELVVLVLLLTGQLGTRATELSTVSPRPGASPGNTGDSRERQTIEATSGNVLREDSMHNTQREVSTLHSTISMEDSALQSTIPAEVSTSATLRSIIQREVSVTEEVPPYDGFNQSTYTTSASHSECLSDFTGSRPDSIGADQDDTDYVQKNDVIGHIGETPIAWTLLCLSACSVVTNSLSIVVHRKKAIALATFLIVQSGADILQACLTTVIQLPVLFPPPDELVMNATEASDTTVPFTIIRSLEMALQRASLALSTVICVDRFLLLSNPMQGHTSIQRYSKSAIALILAFVCATGGFEFYALYMENIRFTAARTQSNAICNGTGIAASFRVNTVSPDVHVSEDRSTFLPDTTFNVGFTGIRDDPRITSELRGQSSASNIDASSKETSEQFTDVPSEDTTQETIEVSTEARIEDYSVGSLEAICQKIALLTNVLMYLALALLILLNTATLISLKKHVQQSRKLGVGGMGHRQTFILASMAAVYVTLALPYMSLSLVRNLRIWPEFDIAGKQALLFVIMAKGASIFEQLKNISDFVVFVVMSRVFRATLVAAMCKRKRTNIVSRSTCTATRTSSVIGSSSEDTFTSRI